MTYLDKIMQAISFNDELLTAEEIELLRKCCKAGICVCVSPSRFSFLRGSEASPEPPFDKEWDKEISNERLGSNQNLRDVHLAAQRAGMD